MKKISKTEIDNLIEKFTNKTLPKSEWNHEAHIMVAIWHNLNYEFEKALALVKSKIISYNEAVGTLNTNTAGYHESLTIFWMIYTKNYLIENNHLSPEEVYHQFLNSESSNKNIGLEYYSTDKLFSVHARKKWINGDVQKICLIRNPNTPSHFNLTDDEFETAFRDCTLDPKLFTHEAHLRLAWIHIEKYGIQKAVDNICHQILDYVTHLNATDKYNKTLTVAAIKAVRHFADKSASDHFSDFILEFPRLQYNFKTLIAKHYGFDIFNSEAAKKEYIAPDLLPFE